MSLVKELRAAANTAPTETALLLEQAAYALDSIRPHGKPSDPDLITIALPILQGLLASGHYTQKYDGDNAAITEDNGKDWKGEGARKRFSIVAVDEAIWIASDLISALQFREEERAARAIDAALQSAKTNGGAA